MRRLRDDEFAVCRDTGNGRRPNSDLLRADKSQSTATDGGPVVPHTPIRHSA